MTKTSDKMTNIRVPKYIVELIDEARENDLLGLSQGQMVAKLVLEALGRNPFVFKKRKRGGLCESA